MRATVSLRAYYRWARYWVEEPWGPYRDNVHAGLIAATIINVQRWKQRNPPGRDASFADFMLKDPETQKEHETAESLKSLFAMAKRVPREKKKKQKQKSKGK